MSHPENWVWRALMKACDGLNINLPPSTMEDVNFEQGKRIIDALKAELGEVSKSDYFKCSEERFSHIVSLAQKFLCKESRLLDIGNSPGYWHKPCTWPVSKLMV